MRLSESYWNDATIFKVNVTAVNAPDVNMTAVNVTEVNVTEVNVPEVIVTDVNVTPSPTSEERWAESGKQ